MTLKLLAFLFLLSGCTKSADISSMWEINLNVQQKSLPFILDIPKDKKSAVLFNATERIQLELTHKDGKWLIPLKSYDAAMEFTAKENSLSGTWTRYNKKKPYILPFLGKRITKSTFTENAQIKSLPKKWKITFAGKDDKPAILLFSEKKGITYASVLTTTGDYRFLRPVLKEGKLYLYGFDGLFSFVFEGSLTPDKKKYQGEMFAGKSWHQKFIAVPDDKFELKDPNSITTSSKKSLSLKLTSLDGKEVDINSPKYADKPKVIQIFGSWCPNCIDETNYILEWKKTHTDDAYFFIVAFERSPNKKHAMKMLKKFKKTYTVDYPILIGGFTRDDKLDKIFSSLENFASFPTMIILDKAGKIRKIHSGFNGPATGMYYEKFDMDFTKTIEQLGK